MDWIANVCGGWEIFFSYRHNSTLGARGFSCAVSGSPLVASASDIDADATGEKQTSGTQGITIVISTVNLSHLHNNTVEDRREADSGTSCKIS